MVRDSGGPPADAARVRSRAEGTDPHPGGWAEGHQDHPKVLEQLMEQAKESATRSISIRIPITDLERARRVAEETGVGYQTVLKQAIRDGLKRVR